MEKPGKETLLHDVLGFHSKNCPDPCFHHVEQHFEEKHQSEDHGHECEVPLMIVRCHIGEPFEEVNPIESERHLKQSDDDIDNGLCAAFSVVFPQPCHQCPRWIFGLVDSHLMIILCGLLPTSFFS